MEMDFMKEKESLRVFLMKYIWSLFLQEWLKECRRNWGRDSGCGFLIVNFRILPVAPILLLLNYTKAIQK